MKDINNKLFLLVTFALISCKNDIQPNYRDDSAIRYQYYSLENRGWKSMTHSIKIDDINFTATEVPLQYYLLKDDPNQDLIKIDSLFNENKKERIVEFVFQQDNEKDLLQQDFTHLDYQKGVEYMSFKIQDDFTIVTSKNDTIKCSGVLFERNFKVSPQNKILLFFSNINPEDKIQLIYQDKLFNKGTLKFRFKEQILNL